MPPRWLQMPPDASWCLPDTSSGTESVRVTQEVPKKSRCIKNEEVHTNSKLNTRADSQKIFREYSVVNPHSYFLRGVIVLHSGGNVSNACVPMFSLSCVLATAENIAKHTCAKWSGNVILETSGSTREPVRKTHCLGWVVFTKNKKESMNPTRA